MSNHTFSTLIKFIFLFLFINSCNQAEQSENANKVVGVVGSRQLVSNNNTQDTSYQLSDRENKIIDSLFQLKEIKERQKYIEEQTKGARHLKIWIAAEPDQTNKYYWIKAGEDNGTNLVTHFNFYVYPDSMRIMYYDVVDDKEISLKEWREINSR